MTDREEIKPTAHELMELHLDALFTHDHNMRLIAINEPWSGAATAPRFFLGRTIEGTTLCRFRYDVPEMLVEQLEELCADEPIARDIQTKPKNFKAYMNLLQGERFTMGPCYIIPGEATPKMQVVSITRENIAEFLLDGFEWLTLEIEYVQPCIALVHESRVVSICRSVRITSKAHEAGLETLNAFRGRGYAAAVVAVWAMDVRKLGSIPLYSTSWENLASQKVARKLALSLYGVNFIVI
ncbi:kasugamycin N-acetyltransferase AAC(2')-IIb [Paenibacillus montanisoli]|uniref:Kasugamycin N-acetyltransferase AAC(2')-IIb n=1 Tax=Paenibacillus montanisoli TaxID=2081970 RepID=A0A328U3Q3_9BACL|nr:kasugamycin N-acetyltransferase AAC(2')-IIb [Paenibacillus montanisoli]RAP77269.1 kasugamycin N-acetyltransferase AAC(2')-IIb [Paenibacillus montanisoli]